MTSYDEYINKLKKGSRQPDFDRLYFRVDQKARVRPKVRLALAAAFAVLLIGFVAYVGFQSQQTTDGDILMSYVFEQESLDGPLLDYVFGD